MCCIANAAKNQLLSHFRYTHILFNFFKISSRITVFFIRLYVLDYLKVKNKEFRALYKELNLEQLSKKQKGKIVPIAVDAAIEDLKIAL